MPAKSLRQLSRDEVKSHNNEKSCWIIIDSYVYDVTNFIDLHPGGVGVITEVAGKDVTGGSLLDFGVSPATGYVETLNRTPHAIDAFYGLHRQEVLHKFGPKYVIGQVCIC